MSDYCPVFSGPGAQLQAHDLVFYYQQLRRGPPPTTGRRWNRGAERHSAAVPYARQDNARLRYSGGRSHQFVSARQYKAACNEADEFSARVICEGSRFRLLS